MFFVYVLHSKKFDRLYIGQTSNLEQRIKSHNHLSKKGYTFRFRPWVLVHAEIYHTRSTALKRERALKSGQGRAWIRHCIILQGSYPPEADAGSSSA